MFKLATTSFIIKDTRINNAIFLCNKIDELELLYFDSKNIYDIPNDFEINQLKKIPINYNIHMPTDIDLTEEINWEKMVLFARKLKILKPSTYTIHPIDNKNFYYGLEKFAALFSPVSIENLNNNLNIFKIIKNTNIDICFDLGHAILYNLNIKNFLKEYENKITHIHLHGVFKNIDHKSINYLDRKLLRYIIDFAISKKVTLCIEVFNEKDFCSSLHTLNNMIS
jgi:hypothetical protein